jgi:murein DD-endopeptidase
MTKQFAILLLIIASLLVSNVPSSGSAHAQKLSAVPVDLQIPLAPTPVKANGKFHLFYELHITNFRSRSLELTRVEVIGDNEAKPLASYRNAELQSRLARPGTMDTADKRIIGGGMRAVMFLQITVEREAELPRSLHHRLFFTPDDPKLDSAERVVDGARVIVQRSKPLVLSPPLRGDRWLATDALANDSTHRRTLLVVNGNARIAQRFAIDWSRIGADGQAFHGDPSKNANWYPYGAEVLAVANAVVVDVKDGIPENDPTADEKAVPITIESAPGNYIILDLGDGHFAFYAHLQPNSFRVKLGDKVRRGQALALLGNSGNADAPHLHFHLTNGNSPLGAEGVPYVFSSFEVLGVIDSLKVLVNGEGWKPTPGAKVDKRRFELPIRYAVISFP